MMVAPLAEVYCLLGELKAARCWFIPTLSPRSYTIIHFAFLYLYEMLKCICLYFWYFRIICKRISVWLWTLYWWPNSKYQGWAWMTFGHLGTGTGMAQPIPKLWEREWKISFLTFGNGNGKIPFPIFWNGNGNFIPAFREREWDVVIPGNDREWEWELHRKIEFFMIPLFNPT